MYAGNFLRSFTFKILLKETKIRSAYENAMGKQGFTLEIFYIKLLCQTKSARRTNSFRQRVNKAVEPITLQMLLVSTTKLQC